MVMAMSEWQQQKLDGLRNGLAVLFARRVELAAAGDHEQAKRLDGDIEELARSVANIERALKDAAT
jgi:hypothetical protein